MSGDVAAFDWPSMSGTGEATLFWVTAVLMVLAALGVLLFKRAAYAVLSMVAVMVGMAVLYLALEAPFNGSVQVIVYTGAILMLFLFVIMMIGLGATDQYADQRRGFIVAGLLLGLAMAALFVTAVFMSKVPGPGTFFPDPAAGLAYTNEPVTSLAVLLFQNHWMTIQVTAALLITAALGAMTLTHSDAVGPRLTQRVVANARMKEYAKTGHHITQQPTPGVFATGNAVDNPAISGDTLTVVEDSVPRVLRLKGLEKPLGQVSPQVAEALQLARTTSRKQSRWGNEVKVEQSKAWGMAGAPAPTGLNQLRAEDLEVDQ